MMSRVSRCTACSLEHGLAVVERRARDHHDGIEWSRQGADEGGVLDVADHEGKTGMGRTRPRDHALAEIHPNPERRLERREQVAGAASELEHAGARGDQELQVEQILVVEEGRALEPFPPLGRTRVGEAADLLLARRHGATGAM